MADSLYIAMSGAREVLNAQSINSNNLANVSTPGFREDFHSALELTADSSELSSDVYAVASKPSSNFTPGAIITTGRDLDVAINGDGWFAVQTPDGGEAYTRYGSFMINENGQLQTSSGLLVLGNGGPIAIPPAESMTIAGDGTISIRPVGQEASALAVIDRIKLVKPDTHNLQKGEDGLFRTKDQSQPEADGSVRIVNKAVESSNVNAVDSMINIISLARQFEMQVKMMEQSQQNGQSLAQLLQISS